MASRKARKRAYIPPAHEVLNKREADEQVRTVRATRGADGGGRGGRGGAAYEYPVPSWRRTLRRLPIYFAMIFLLQFYLADGKGDASDGERALMAAGMAAIVTAAFAPFMHMMDRFAYNRWLRRNGATDSAK